MKAFQPVTQTILAALEAATNRAALLSGSLQSQPGKPDPLHRGYPEDTFQNNRIAPTENIEALYLDPQSIWFGDRPIFERSADSPTPQCPVPWFDAWCSMRACRDGVGSDH